jgi:PEP-CTERM motif
MKSELKNFVVSLAIVGIAGIAHGIPVGPILSISDGVDPVITINDNLAGDLNPTVGELTLSTNVGVWSLSISTGVSKPNLGSSTNPVMDLVIQASSTGAGSLTYTFSDLSFSHGPGTLNSTVSGQVIYGLPTTVDYSVYGDSNNVAGALTTLLTTTGTNSLPVVASASGPLTFASSFSLSQVVQLTASGASAVSVDASLNVIPEPSSAALAFLGLGLLIVGLAHRRHSLHRIS